MKVLHMISGGDTGGAKTHVFALLGKLKDRADVTIVCQRPKLKDYIEAMRENLAAHLGIDPDCVNVKATTTEKLGFEGECLGISAHAVACIERA